MQWFASHADSSISQLYHTSEIPIRDSNWPTGSGIKNDTHQSRDNQKPLPARPPLLSTMTAQPLQTTVEVCSREAAIISRDSTHFPSHRIQQLFFHSGVFSRLIDNLTFSSFSWIWPHPFSTSCSHHSIDAADSSQETGCLWSLRWYWGGRETHPISCSHHRLQWNLHHRVDYSLLHQMKSVSCDHLHCSPTFDHLTLLFIRHVARNVQSAHRWV